LPAKKHQELQELTELQTTTSSAFEVINTVNGLYKLLTYFEKALVQVKDYSWCCGRLMVAVYGKTSLSSTLDCCCCRVAVVASS